MIPVASRGIVEQSLEFAHVSIGVDAELRVGGVAMGDLVRALASDCVDEAPREDAALAGNVAAPQVRRGVVAECTVEIDGKRLQLLDDMERLAVEVDRGRVGEGRLG